MGEVNIQHPRPLPRVKVQRSYPTGPGHMGRRGPHSHPEPRISHWLQTLTPSFPPGLCTPHILELGSHPFQGTQSLEMVQNTLKTWGHRSSGYRGVSQVTLRVSGRCRPEPGPTSKTFLHPGPFCIPSYGHQSLFGPQVCPRQGRWGRVGSGCPARLVTTSCTPLALSSWQNTVAATPGLNFTAQNS